MFRFQSVVTTSKVADFILRGNTVGRGFGKGEGEWTRMVEIRTRKNSWQLINRSVMHSHCILIYSIQTRKVEIRTRKIFEVINRSIMHNHYSLTYFSFHGRTVMSCRVPSQASLHFCVFSTGLLRRCMNGELVGGLSLIHI